MSFQMKNVLRAYGAPPPGPEGGDEEKSSTPRLKRASSKISGIHIKREDDEFQEAILAIS